MKKVLVLVLFSLLLMSFFSVVLVQAAVQGADNSNSIIASNPNSNGASALCKFIGWSNVVNGEESNWFCKRLAMWEPGITPNTDMGAVAIFFKYVMLFILVILVYSGLDYANFPESSALKIIIAILLGFLLTFLVSTNELITAMASYSALGITLIIFFPIMILGFFTILVASKANPVGIFIQRIMWIIYGVFLLIKSGTLALGMWWASTGNAANIGNPNTAFGQFVQFIVGKDISAYTNVSSAVLITLFIVSIAILYLMVWKDHMIVAWLAKEKREAELEGEKATIDRSNAYDKLRAQKMESQK